jgi:glycosyltransferase involved in cell wall biosynthesis
LKVAYFAAVFNASGYSDAARNYVMALTHQGLGVEVVPLNFENFESDHGRVGQLIKNMVCHNPTADIQIIHTVPGVFSKFIRSDKYNIGYTVWEADRLPPSWVKQINELNEVWVPTQYNYEVFKNSGINITITIIPHTFDRKIFQEETAEVSIQGINSNDYTFYSIFQWIERKNPVALLKAYLTEFKVDEDVCLVLKTYLFNPTDRTEREKIKKVIDDVKFKLRLSSYPKILLVADILSKPQIHAIHKSCDCYLSFHRSEGFGIVPVEAMMAGNPVISTDYSGPKDFVTPRTGFPINYQLTPVYGMPWEAYTGDQVWADIDIMKAREKMRWVFENRGQAKGVASIGRQFIDNNFSWEVIGQLMKKRLEEINASRR